MDDIKVQELENRFTYHPPKEGQSELYKRLRREGLNLAELVTAIVPESREQSLAITKIEEAVMWANAGIARRSGE